MTWALDVGSTSIKCCHFDLDPETPRLLHESSYDRPLVRPQPGWVEHDLAGMASIFTSFLDGLPSGAVVGLASAMHALVLLDGQGEPLTEAISWADTRSDACAEELLRDDPQAYERTGVPLHSMAWPAKLLWVARQRPDWWRRLHRVCDLKSYLWEKALGQRAPMDRGSASGTGLWNVAQQSWDETLCRRLQLSSEQLPLVEGQHRVRWQGKTVHLGGADGPLGNLGLGAVCEGRIAISVGTSGAVRRFHQSAKRPSAGLFLYALGCLGWVEGGAISNGGSVLRWLREAESVTNDEIFTAVEATAIGADGLLVHPYFMGERAPFWRAGVTPAVHGRTEQHQFRHLARAALEGVAFCLYRLLEMLKRGPEPLRCTGGVFSSPVWCQLLADVVGWEVAVSPVSEATALGAALLTLDEPLARAQNLPPGATWSPDPVRHERYRSLYWEWLALDPAAS